MLSGIVVVAFFMHIYNNIKPTVSLILAIDIAIIFLTGLYNYWRLLKISEAPISTIAAAAQGYIELQGKASTEKPLKTPYHGIACVWYRAYAYANREASAQDNDNSFMDKRLLEYSESKQTFLLKDATGTCSVNPAGAEVIHFEARTFRKNDHRYVEEYLPVGKPLYLLGQLDTRHDVMDEKTLNKKLSEKLARLKANKPQLLNRYDQNRDGQIDLHEWEKARQEAHECLLAEHAMQHGLGNFTLKKPADHHLFLISAKSPQQLRNSYKNWLFIHLSLLSLLVIIYTQQT